MLTLKERQIIVEVSKRWTGPNTWAWVDGYRGGLPFAVENPGFG